MMGKKAKRAKITDATPGVAHYWCPRGVPEGVMKSAKLAIRNSGMVQVIHVHERGKRCKKKCEVHGAK